MNGRRRADSRALLLALALEAAPAGAPRVVRFGRRKSAFVATLVAAPGDYDVMGFLITESGLDVLWRRLAGPRLVRESNAGQ